MLSTEERGLLVDQALALIEQVYVHLPLKRAMHATDPLQRLKLLRRHVSDPDLGEPAFHAELLSIFTHLRDLHTTYILPAPFRTTTAYLPFRLEECFDGDQRSYVVTRVKPEKKSRAKSFKPGVRVTHWNGVPIHRAVEVNADREGGSNQAARHARGLAAMTLRPLAMSLPPDEEWVVVTYEADGRCRKRKFDWQVFAQGSPGTASGPLAGDADRDFMLGLDAKAELEREANNLLFAPEAVAEARAITDQAERAIGASPTGGMATAGGLDFSLVSRLPELFSFRRVKTPSGSFGYIRIHTFKMPPSVSTDAFLQEFIRIAALLPQQGLILDLRGNGGGHIIAGERLLQLLAPGPIEPERFHFINSPLTLRICNAQPSMAPWRESIEQSVETGAAFSDGFPLLPLAAYNDIGQRYQGPVVLVIDARCYSTTDIFCAGFQDHGIGRILGTSRTTGAGGANVWDHELLRRVLSDGDSPFKPLPRDASFSLAVRRCTRVGRRAGALVEDLGVVADEIHRLTRRDVLKENVDLIARAGRMLAAMPVQSVAARLPAKAPGRVEIDTRNVDRLDLFVDRRPHSSIDVTDGTIRLALPDLEASSNMLEIRGFRQNEWVATTRLDRPGNGASVGKARGAGGKQGAGAGNA